jgi:hypothetical protein
MAKAARLAHQAAGKDSPSAEEARDLSAQLEAAAARNRLSGGGGNSDGVVAQSARGAEAAARWGLPRNVAGHGAISCARKRGPRRAHRNRG